MVEFVRKPAEDMTVAEKWMHYKRAEQEVKEAMEGLKKEALLEVTKNGGFYRGSTGAAQVVTRNETKPKESLKTLLAEKGLLELCQKDDIDMKKVQSMVDAGMITEDELGNHVSHKQSTFLKLK